MLEGLDETDQGFASAVRKAIFTFGNIPDRVAPRDIPRILRDVEPGDLVLAIAGAEACGMKRSADYILENMSGRMADQLREDVQELAKPKQADVDAAMSVFITIIRTMETAGEILLLVPEDPEEEDA
jgi:flagellar motor switch protein FliG